MNNTKALAVYLADYILEELENGLPMPLEQVIMNGIEAFSAGACSGKLYTVIAIAHTAADDIAATDQPQAS